jgi:hypothetical protein
MLMCACKINSCKFISPTSCWGTSWPKSSRTLTRLLFLDTPEHVDFENLIKQTFFKTWFLLHKMCLKLAKIDQKWKFSIFWKSLILYCIRSKNVWDVFHDLKNVKIAKRSLKICQFWPILANFSYILWPDRKNRINLIPSRYHWDQLDAKVIVLDINFPVREFKSHFEKSW